MILEGRGISGGIAEGKVVVTEKRVSFLGDADPDSGMIFDKIDVKDRVFAFGGGKGSTVGSYVIYRMKKNKTSPLAMINESTETIVAAGAIISDIPLVDDIQIDLLVNGDKVMVDGDLGIVKLNDIELQPVITVFVEKDGKILLLKRSEKVGSYRYKWAGISGYQEFEAVLQARKEIDEETEMEAEFISKGDPILVRYKNKVWKITPMLFKTEGEPRLNWENSDYRWVEPELIKDMDTVPKLWEAYVKARSGKDESKDR